MFYDEFTRLCSSKGVSRTKACIDCGVSRTAWHKWEDGATPNGTTINKFAAYFGVPVGLLLGEETKKAPTQTDGRELPHADRREVIAGPGISIMLDADAKVTDAQLEDIINFIEFQQRKYGK